ncbi:MAG TPA: hypothetical protein VFH52_10005 [Rhodanobacteraceae bacterium]|nr:hypothetical protein [Rhodanobacteraceae bacterium]
MFRSLGRIAVLASLLGLAISHSAGAVPAFARQTGQACVACHVSFPELTPYGRLFKLSGYTIGSRLTLPLAFMVQAGDTGVRKNRDDQGAQIVPKTHSTQVSSASLFVAGKINDNVGGWIQWTYNNLYVNDAGKTVGHSGIDNTDLRVVGRQTDAEGTSIRWLYGLTIHNSPTVQDVWNSTPAFGFPFTLPPNMISPVAATMLDGTLAQQVAGVGGYVFWNRSLYFELTGYRTADGIFSPLRAGQDVHTPGGVHRLAGLNPYWRLAWNREWGSNSLMLGAYGLRVRVYPDNTLPFTPTDRYTDIAVDAQYQYITDPHTFALQATRIHERQSYLASFPASEAGAAIGAGPAPANPRDTLNTSRLKATYYFRRRYGVTLSWFSTTGSSDSGLYAPGSVDGSLSGKPDTNGYITEFDYLPVQNLRLMLQYYDYRKFNGGRANYDGSGRSAKDNNTWFLNLWFVY